MAAPACAPSPPIWALPVTDLQGSDLTCAAGGDSLSAGLLALRRKMESGNHKYADGRTLAPPPLPSLPRSHNGPTRPFPSLPFDALTSSAGQSAQDMLLRTPQAAVERGIPLETPPTPGHKRRFVGRKESTCPRFLPLGIVSREQQRLSGDGPSAVSKRASANEYQRRGNRDSTFRIAPRYECPWLAEGAASSDAPPPVAAIEIKRAVGAEATEPAKTEEETASSPGHNHPALYRTLQAAARIKDTNEPGEARSMSMGLGSSYSVDGSARRSSLNMLPPSEHFAHRPSDGFSWSKSDGLRQGPPPNKSYSDPAAIPFSGDVPATRLARSVSMGHNTGKGGNADKTSNGMRVPIPNLPEMQERKFQATSA